MSTDSPSSGLRIRTYREGDAVVVHLNGELDLESVADLDRALGLAREESRLLVVDLSGLHFMDSLGLATLVRASIAADVGGDRLRLRRLMPQDYRVFELSGLDDAFEIER